MIATDPSKALKGEPAVIIGAVIAVLQVVASIIAGTTEAVEGSTAIAGVVLGIVIPLIQAVATRSQVTPVEKSVQADAL